MYRYIMHKYICICIDIFVHRLLYHCIVITFKFEKYVGEYYIYV